MSEPQVDAPPSDATSTTFLLDGDAPRLGGGTSTPPTPPTVAFEPPVMAAPAAPASPHGPSPLLSAPGAAPLLGSTDLSPRPTLPTISEPVVPAPVADVPMLPTVATPTPTSAPATVPMPAPEPEPDVAPSAPTHPMAHLMPEKAAVSEASKRAAEIRAAKKAKARKIKIGAALAALVVAVLAGPPLVGWVSDALNDAGSTTTVDG